ncbi:gp53-like domain-containing protein [Proteus mirabilis]|uniref:gp53-like domain-containing protein n=1 Tax=Proteus mirabilis TaxID=584 RepID=UPI003558ED5B
MNIQDKPDYKIFASEARGGEVTDFPNLERGWGETIDKTEKIPPMEWFNLVGKRADEWLLYLTQRGVAEWDAKVKYPQYAMCQFGGRFYIAVDENENKNPVNSQAVWIDLAKYLGVDGKLDANRVVQTTGQSTTNIMSQKAVTDALGKKINASDLPVAIALLKKRGYWVCPNTGFMIQWGTESPRAAGTYTYQLPAPFPNEGLFAVGNVGRAVPYNNDEASGSVGNLTKTTIQVTMDNNLPTAWIAIGY